MAYGFERRCCLTEFHRYLRRQFVETTGADVVADIAASVGSTGASALIVSLTGRAPTSRRALLEESGAQEQ
jgi:hypothetical protein